MSLADYKARSKAAPRAAASGDFRRLVAQTAAMIGEEGAAQVFETVMALTQQKVPREPRGSMPVKVGPKP